MSNEKTTTQCEGTGQDRPVPGSSEEQGYYLRPDRLSMYWSHRTSSNMPLTVMPDIKADGLWS